MKVLLNCAEHNLRLILKRLRDLCARFFVVQFFVGLIPTIVYSRAKYGVAALNAT